MDNNYWKVELENCSFVKTILMFMVVAYHSIVFWSGEWFEIYNNNNYLMSFDILSQWLNSIHIYGFTLVSGYIFYYLRSENNGYSNFRNYLFNKVRRLIVPYCFVGTVWVIPITQHFYNYSFWEIVKRFIFAENPGQLWFLIMLFEVFVIVWLLSNVIENDIYAMIIALGSFLLSFVGKHFFENIFCVWTACRYMPYFILGMKIRQKKQWIIRKIPSGIYFILDILIFVIWLNTQGAVKIIIGLPLTVVGAVMAFFILQKIASVINWKGNKCFSKMTRYSMGVYLFHQQLIYICIALLIGKVCDYAIGIINFVVAISVSVYINCILSKFRIFRYLLGDKQ